MRIFRKLNETKSNRSIFWVSLPTLQTFLNPPLFILIPNFLKNKGAVLKKSTPLIRGSPSLRSVLFTHYVLPWSRNIMQMIQYVLFLNLSDRPCQPLYTATPFWGLTFAQNNRMQYFPDFTRSASSFPPIFPNRRLHSSDFPCNNRSEANKAITSRRFTPWHY